MPEGDTVWLAARRLHDALTGRTVTEVVSRGKHLLFRLNDGDNDPLTLHTHFRMDSCWHLYRPGEAWRGGPQWQVRSRRPRRNPTAPSIA